MDEFWRMPCGDLAARLVMATPTAAGMGPQSTVSFPVEIQSNWTVLAVLCKSWTVQFLTNKRIGALYLWFCHDQQPLPDTHDHNASNAEWEVLEIGNH